MWKRRLNFFEKPYFYLMQSNSFVDYFMVFSCQDKYINKNEI
jgi:hypothetical protein